MSTNIKPDPNRVAGLRRERVGYVQRGLTDRVRQVDEQIAFYGGEPEPDTEAPKGRSAPRKSTADAPARAQV